MRASKSRSHPGFILPVKNCDSRDGQPGAGARAVRPYEIVNYGEGLACNWVARIIINNASA